MSSKQDATLTNGGEHARTIIERQLNGIDGAEKQSLTLLTYATTWDKAILIVSSICAILAGALNPLVPVIYGLLVSIYNGFEDGSVSASELRDKVSTFSLYYVYLSIALFFLTYFATVGYYYSGERIARSVRTAYLSAIMRQNMAFFDLVGSGEITNRIVSDMGTVQEAITSKLSVMLSALAQFCAAFVVAFIMYWKTALILSPFFVAMIVSASLGGAYAVKHHKRAMTLYGQASSITQEAFGAIRQVTAFGMSRVLSQRYVSLLSQAGEANSKAENVVAALIAWMNAMPCLIDALSFWAGSKFLVKGEMSVADVTTTTLAVTIGCFAIIRIAPSAQALISGFAAAAEVFKTIARSSSQDPLDTTGEQPQSVVGNIQLEHVDLVYPSRDDVGVLRNVSLECPAMKRTAIVGSSGSGKSSILALLERFYEPTGGKVILDGKDIQSLNLRWLRSQIALVDQNPVLFNATILENIQYGCCSTNDEPSHQAVIRAAIKANAHDFITALPHGYHTRVGEKGLQLSGGQRQRIAIARALIRDPRILLLDEATSALDSKTESVVQSAIDAACQDRTTIMIAHRLSTVRNADNIIVLAQGHVAEEGNHESLIAKNGVYASLVQKQQIQDDAARLPDKEDGKEEVVVSNSVDELNEKSTLTESPDRPFTIKAQESTNPTTDAPSQSTSAKKTLFFIFKMSRENWKMLLFGLICAILAGLTIPAQSVLFAKLLTIMGFPAERYTQLQNQTKLWSGLYIAIAGATFIFWMGVETTLAYATQQLSQRVRQIGFQTIMIQDMAFFDEPANTTNALSNVLSNSTDDLAGMGGPVMGGILTFISTILGGIILSLVVGWKLALVCTATIPIVVACGWLRLQILNAFDTKVRQSGIDSAAYAGELIGSVRTVASLGLEEYSMRQYDSILAQRSAKSLQSILSASSLYAASQSVVYLCAALAFWYGGQLIADREYSTFQVYVCFVSLISGSQIAGSIFTFAPDASKAMHASQELDKVMQAKPKINHALGNAEAETEKHDMQAQHPKGCRIEFENVTFSYPSRPDRLALNNFSIIVEPGQTLALIGQTGSGKSTCVSLLERFYEPDLGRVLVDRHDITELDVNAYRQTISLVSQESIMFSGTIRENIAVGQVEREVSDPEIMEACRQANIIDFVQSLPEGLSTLVGTSGNMLSGGQKQRIAIARAFLRKPKILLLDEATSALDTESEAIVQAAMDTIRRGRTTIMVAHRLSTIRNAEIICVMENGMLIESGSHHELMSLRGKYWEMVGMQNLH